MEGEVTVEPLAPPAPPAPPAAPVQYAPAPVAAPPAEASDVFGSMAQKHPMDFKSMLLFGLLIAVSIYGIVYYRKGIQNFDEQKSKNDEFLAFSDDLEEVKYNVKKALGKNYKPTT